MYIQGFSALFSMFPPNPNPSPYPIQIKHHKIFSFAFSVPFPASKSLFSLFYVPLNFPDCRNPSLYSAYLPAYPSPFLMGLFLFLVLVSYFQISLILKGFQVFSPFYFPHLTLSKALWKAEDKRENRVWKKSGKMVSPSRSLLLILPHTKTRTDCVGPIDFGRRSRWDWIGWEQR